jgi:tetratricopeptide (TPR) repeat protein
VPWTEPLTSDDLDEIGQAAVDADDPLKVATELVGAVEQGRLADKADTGYALSLAAEITEREDDLDAALALADRAVEAYRVHGDAGDGYPRAFRAELMLRLGQEDKAMAEFAALRPLMGPDPDAVSYVSEALQAAGQAEIAEQWLSAALETALERCDGPSPRRADPADGSAEVVYALAQQRHLLRRDLDLPHDERDDLADRLQDAVYGGDPDDDEYDEDEYKTTAVLFWPREEFDRVVGRWPVLVEAYGHGWDKHRARLQHGPQLLADSGRTGLALLASSADELAGSADELAGSADELAGYAARIGGDPTDPDVREGYTQHLESSPRETAWPPGRNEACWCGSGLKYKKCCLPRSRT